MPANSRHALRVQLVVRVAAALGSLALLIVPALAVAQQASPWLSADHVAAIPREELDAISARGRLLAEYDVASWHGTDAVIALRPREGAVRVYLARRQPDGRWEVVFGRSSASADSFFVAYRAVQRELRDTVYDGEALEPEVADTGYYARAARALDVSRREFGSATRPYNAMVVLAAGGDEWLVYLVPAPTRAGVWPLGADVRYRVTSDGRRITERRRLHNTVLEFGAGTRNGETPTAGLHSAVLSDRPEDTDVLHVLTREPRVPEYIVSRSYYFRVDADGTIAAYDREKTGK